MSDPTQEVAKAYGVLMADKPYANRWTFIIGKDGKILEVLQDVSPAKHGHELAERLAKLGVPKKSP